VINDVAFTVDDHHALPLIRLGWDVAKQFEVDNHRPSNDKNQQKWRCSRT
jgi:hypothetical protein